MFTRITYTRPFLRHSLSNYRLLTTSRIANNSLGLNQQSSITSSSNSILSSSPYTTSTIPSKKWARHVISTNPLPEEDKKEEVRKADESGNKKRRKRRTLKPLKAPITLTENAKSHLRALSNGPNPKLIRISVRNRGCSGLSYHLEYVDKPEKFDEIVTQDDINVVIDSKALFSIIGSEMDWVDNKLSSKFVFKNPNSKGTCGCGESFMV